MKLFLKNWCSVFPTAGQFLEFGNFGGNKPKFSNWRSSGGNLQPGSRKPDNFELRRWSLSVKILIPLLALSLITGCAFQTVRVAPEIKGNQPTVVNVIVIRDTSDFRGPQTSEKPWAVTVDDYAFCQLNPGEYTMLHAVEGDAHWVGIQRLQVWWHKEKDFFIGEPGGNYYFLAGVRDNDMFIERIDQKTAWPLIHQYKQVCVEAKPLKAKREMPVPAPPPKITSLPKPPVAKVEAKEKTKAKTETKIAPPKVVEIYFDLDSAQIKTQMHPYLDAIVSYLRAVPSSNVILEGHACDLGTDRHNLELSKRRAEAVRSYFLEKDIRDERISLEAFGESKPEYDNSKEETRKLNRQVHVIFQTK